MLSELPQAGAAWAICLAAGILASRVVWLVIFCRCSPRVRRDLLEVERIRARACVHCRCCREAHEPPPASPAGRGRD